MPTRTLGDVRIVTGSGRDHIMYHKARSVGSQHYALHGAGPDTKVASDLENSQALLPELQDTLLYRGIDARPTENDALLLGSR
jgi:hypothetical protein